MRLMPLSDAQTVTRPTRGVSKETQYDGAGGRLPSVLLPAPPGCGVLPFVSVAVLRLAIVAFLGTTVLAGCGASYRQAYFSDAYFERCFAADINPRVNRSDLEECWSAWIAYYGDSENQYRVEYARERSEALALGDGTLPLLRADDPLSAPSSAIAYSGATAETAGVSAEISRWAEPFVVPHAAVVPVAVERVPACRTTCISRTEACRASCAERDSSCKHTCTVDQRVCDEGCP